MAEAIETDAVVVGAGPVGLFQAFQLGLLGLRCEIVDSLPAPGGQCAELYAGKPIYDIPAVPVCTGAELTERLLQQIKPFSTVIHLDQEVNGLSTLDDGRFELTTTRGISFRARVVVVAAGVGAFQARRVKLAALEAFEGSQVRFRLDERAAWAGQRVVVVGGDAAAIDSAIELVHAEPAAASDRPLHVTLLHRRDVLDAPAETLARLHALIAAGALDFVVGQPTGVVVEDGRLAGLELTGPDGTLRALALDRLLVRLGLAPKLGHVAHWGLALERKQIRVDTARFESSVPGIFAVGDVNTYPGKRKLIVCGFHEATLAAYAAAEIVSPDQPVQLQYTTTSTTLQRRLGVATPVTD
ncbi:MAG: NAD(P)/FAD-dependent oxidoreductase [Burkholderiaceae bacterium]